MNYYYLLVFLNSIRMCYVNIERLMFSLFSEKYG